MTRGGAGSATATRTPTPSTAPRRTPPRPAARDEHWSHLRADGALHCTLWVAEWPRIDVRAVFLQPLLMRADTTRTVAVCMELVGPARAIRKAERAMTEAATEESLRGRIGQRTSQRQRQREHAAARQEAELAHGHANVRYSAYVTVSVPDTGPDARDELEAAVSPRRPAGQGRAAAPGADVGPAGARRSRSGCRSAGGSNEKPRAAGGGRRTASPRARAAPRSLAAADRVGWAAARCRASGPGTRSRPRISRRCIRRSPRPGWARRGVYIGRDMHGGSFVYDPWVLYARGVLNDANTLVIGRPDFGKSSLSKTWLLRSRVFGRRGEIVDLKGEYDPLVTRARRDDPAAHPRRAHPAEPADADRAARAARGAAGGDRPRDARPAAQPGRSDRTVRGTRASRPPPRRGGGLHPRRHRAAPRTRPPELADRLGATQRRRAERSCGRSRSRCSGSATGRCAGCSTGRRPPARTCSTRR